MASHDSTTIAGSVATGGEGLSYVLVADEPEKASWTNEEGGYMVATLEVDVAPVKNDGSVGRVIVGQIHGADDELVRLYWHDTDLYFISSRSGKETTFRFIDADGNSPDVSVNERFSYSISFQGDLLDVRIYADGKEYTSINRLDDSWYRDWESDTYYFKAGMYLGVTDDTSSLNVGNGAGQSSFYQLEVTHNGATPPPALLTGLDEDDAPSGNFDLDEWKITLPIDSKGRMTGTATEILELAGYENATYFYTADDGAMVFYAPVEGAVTSGSKFARSELREMEDGSLDGLVFLPDGSFVFTPPPGAEGDFTFQYRVVDASGQLSAPRSFTIRVDHVNDPPVAASAGNALSGVQDTMIEGSVPAASDPDGDALTYALVEGPDGFTLDADGSFSFAPPAGVTGDFTFSYKAVDPEGLESPPQTFTISVTRFNNAPVAAADGNEASGVEDTVVTGQVPAASDPDGDPVTYVLVDGPAGLVLGADGGFTFAPPANANGDLTFRYKAVDSLGGGSAPQTFTISLAAVNDAPVAAASGNAASGVENTVIAGSVPIASDPDGDALTYALVDGPAGLVFNGDGSFSFTPQSDATGDFTFRYKAVDPSGLESAPKSFAITVEPLIKNLTVTGTDAANTLHGGAGDDTIDGGKGADTMYGHGGDDTYHVDNSKDRAIEAVGEGVDTVIASTSFTIADDGEVEILRATGSSAATLKGNRSANIIVGNDAVNTIEGWDGDDIIDGGLGSDKLKGGGGKDVLVFSTALGSANIDELVEFKVADDKIVLDRTIFSALAPGALAAGAFVKGTAAADAADRIIYDSAGGRLLYDPDGQGGQTALQFATLPKSLALTEANFMVMDGVDQLLGNNAAPVAAATGNAVSGDEDTAIAGRVPAGSDPDGDEITYALDGSLSGLVFRQDGSFTFTPPADATGDFTFRYKAVDASGAESAPRSFIITVDAVNDAPVAASSGNAASGDESTVIAGSVPAGSDPDGDALTYVLADGPEGLVLDADGSFAFTPPPDAFGDFTFRYKAVDPGGLESAPRAFTISVLPVNEPPVAAAAGNAATGEEDKSVEGSVPAASDADGDPLTYALVDGLAGLVFRADGSFAFTPSANATGDFTFRYKAVDASGAQSAPETFTISLAPVNDAPVAASTGNALSAVQDEFVQGSVPAASDADGDVLAYALVDGPDGLILNLDGSFSFVPPAGAVGEFSFHYKAIDLEGLESETQSFTISILRLNHAPVAAVSGNAIAGVEDTPVEGSVPAASDPDGDALTYALVDGPVGLVFHADGTFAFTPPANAHGDFAFRYKAVDPDGLESAPKTFTISLAPVNDAPLAAASGNSALGEENTVLAGAVPAGSDPDGDGLIYALVDGPAGLVFNADGSFAFTPAAHAHGAFSFRYKAVDPAGLESAPRTFTITVAPVNEAPVAAGSGNAASGEEDKVVTGAVPAASDPDGDALTYALVDGPAGLVFKADGSFTFTPATNAHGDVSFRYKAVDPIGLESARQTFTITVAPVNDAPVTASSGNAASGEENKVVTGAVPAASDPDGDALTYALVDGPSGLVFNANGTFAFTPAANAHGDFAFRYKAVDPGGLESAPRTFTISLAAASHGVTVTGTDAANTLNGGVGDDTIDGRKGADMMYGHGGNDIYYVDDRNDKPVETAREGFDTVIVSTTNFFALAEGTEIEMIKGTGVAAATLKGNNLNNVFIGNDGATTIEGRDGDDKLNGGLGRDSLKGGNGKDIFVFSTVLRPDNVDDIADFKVKDDTILLDHSVFSVLTLGSLADSAFVKGTAAVDASDRIIYDSAGGRLFYDADGLGGQAAVQFATLPKSLAMTHFHFAVTDDPLA